MSIKPSDIETVLRRKGALTRDGLVDALVVAHGDSGSPGSRRLILNEVREILGDLVLVGRVQFSPRRGGRWQLTSSSE